MGGKGKRGKNKTYREREKFKQFLDRMNDQPKTKPILLSTEFEVHFLNSIINKEGNLEFDPNIFIISCFDLDLHWC